MLKADETEEVESIVWLIKVKFSIISCFIGVKSNITKLRKKD